jgi:hypothetical protein
VTIQPLLSRGEVYKCAVSHYFDPTRARTDLGYYPLVPYEEAMRRTIAYYSAHHPRRSRGISNALRLLALFLLMGALTIALVLGRHTAA